MWRGGWTLASPSYLLMIRFVGAYEGRGRRKRPHHPSSSAPAPTDKPGSSLKLVRMGHPQGVSLLTESEKHLRNMFKAFPDEGGKGEGCALLWGSRVYAKNFLHFVEAVTDGVDVYGELVGYGLR